jgi:hypothetical protein
MSLLATDYYHNSIATDKVKFKAITGLLLAKKIGRRVTIRVLKLDSAARSLCLGGGCCGKRAQR